MKPLISRAYAGTKHILNPEFKYVKPEHTDVAATFARVRKEQAEQAQQPKKIRRIR